MSLAEVLLVNLYLGSVVYIIGLLIFIFILYTNNKNRTPLIFTVGSCIQLSLSFCLSLTIWKFWPFDRDILCSFLFMPAVFAEVISILILYITIQQRFYKKK